MGKPNLNAPRIERIGIFDGAYNRDLYTFINDTDDVVKFIPRGIHTMSDQWYPTKDHVYKIIGCGKETYNYLYGFGTSSEQMGSTKIVVTSSYGFLYDTTTPSTGFLNGFIFRDLEFGQRVNSLLYGEYMFNSIRSNYVELTNVGMTTYESPSSSGGAIYTTGSDITKLSDVSIYGFGGVSPNRESSMVNTRYCNRVIFDNLTICGYNSVPYSILETEENEYYKINNLHLIDLGDNDYNMNILKSLAGGTNVFKHSMAIDGLILDVGVKFGNAQNGAFEFSDLKYFLLLSNIHNHATSSYNQFRVSGSDYVRNLKVLGRVGGEYTSFRPPNGRVLSPFDNTNRLLTPTCSSPSSVPLLNYDYDVEVRSVTLLVEGGKDVRILLEGLDVPYNTLGTTYGLDVGENIWFYTFSSVPTVNAFFE